jgi:hypothetical protein
MNKRAIRRGGHVSLNRPVLLLIGPSNDYDTQKFHGRIVASYKRTDRQIHNDQRGTKFSLLTSSSLHPFMNYSVRQHIYMDYAFVAISQICWVVGCLSLFGSVFFSFLPWILNYLMNTKICSILFYNSFSQKNKCRK